MRYLLDTNVISELYNNTAPQHENINRHLRALQDEDIVYVSVVTLYEMEYSHANAPEDKKAIIRNYIDEMRTDFEILPVSFDAAPVFGELKKAFKDNYSAINLSSKTEIRKTVQLHNIDLVLAATAICNELILVSADKLFPQLASIDSRLKVVNWRS